MKKLSKVLVALSLVLSVVIVPVNQVMAAEAESQEIVVDGSYLLEELESSHIVYSPLRGYYIARGTGSITMPSAGVITANGNTTAYVSVSSIKVTVMVQRYVSGSWVSVTSWTAENTNAYSVTTSKTLSVTSKYYYRVKTYHTAGGELLTGYTNGIWVI